MAKVEIVLFSALAQVAGEKKVEVEASTLGEALNSLRGRFGEEFSDRLFGEDGNPRRFVNIYVNGRDARFLKNLDTTLNGGDAINLVPAVSGG